MNALCEYKMAEMLIRFSLFLFLWLFELHSDLLWIFGSQNQNFVHQN